MEYTSDIYLNDMIDDHLIYFCKKQHKLLMRETHERIECYKDYGVCLLKGDLVSIYTYVNGEWVNHYFELYKKGIYIYHVGNYVSPYPITINGFKKNYYIPYRGVIDNSIDKFSANYSYFEHV